MKVIKFGGSSLADAKQIKKVCSIVQSDRQRRIVVVSAPGKRDGNDTKVTDLLISLAVACRDNENKDAALDAVVERYASIAKDLHLGKEIVKVIKDDLLGRMAKYSDNYGMFEDLLKAAGEDNSAKLVACYLQSIGENAEYIDPKEAGMILSNEFGNAQVLPHSYELLSKLAQRDTIMIFPGFFGYSEDGDVVTFSRGGSDVTGGILAAAVNADVYENFTDVDFVYAANPKLIENPFPIPLFTYEEMRELSYAGFSVLHEEALAPVYKKGIPVNIRNTNNPDAPGTFIVPDKTAPKPTLPVAGIAADTGFMTIHVYKYMMNRLIGYGCSLLKILEEEGVSFEHMPSGIDSISLIIREKNCPPEKLERIVKRYKEDLSADSVTVDKDQAIVMLVGRGMTKNVGVSTRATAAFAKAKINIRMINQGSSEVSIMFGVEAKDAKPSVIALYNEFFN
ncbi:MAG: aspartate kinase [Ruminococcaceae bacterium]|nr:aspartate kinase [Oscillospiraceae bacterium]